MIDEVGIARDSTPRVALPWSRIRHVVVTRGRRGTRRLLVDDGASGPEAKPQDANASIRAIVDRTRRRFALDVPIDLLDVAADEVINAVRHHSGQRLPDI